MTAFRATHGSIAQAVFVGKSGLGLGFAPSLCQTEGMRILGGLGLALLLASGCGDLDSRARALTPPQVCNELCGWPDECFAQLGYPLEGADCVQTCEAQGGLVGFGCISALNSMISCIGTCDVESLTEAEAAAAAERCQGQVDAISAACD